MSSTVSLIIGVFLLVLSFGGLFGLFVYFDKKENKKLAEQERQRALLCSSLDKHSTALLRLGASVDAFNKLCEGGDKND